MAKPQGWLSLDEHEKVLARIIQRGNLNAYDRGIIQNARQVIQRSRELLEKTQRQVLRPSERNDQSS